MTKLLESGSRKEVELFASIPARKRKKIAVDEKEIGINGKVYLWGAVDVDNQKIIAVIVSKGRSYIENFSFLQRLVRKCE
ncbi:MAG TPA: hypothetical protein ENI45_04865 [Thermoplasmatales archaeon]|nr:hypothetical protein [Thermoplasmatales archaeon]